MEINWLVISIVAVCAIALIIFLVKRNVKDEKELENFLNETETPKKEESEVNDSL